MIIIVITDQGKSGRGFSHTEVWTETETGTGLCPKCGRGGQGGIKGNEKVSYYIMHSEKFCLVCSQMTCIVNKVDKVTCEYY